MLLELPSECVLTVLKQLPVTDVVSTGCSCSALRALVADDGFWRDLAEAKWGSAVHELKALADADAQQRLSSDNSTAAACQTSQRVAEQATAGTPAAAPGKVSGSSSSWQRYCCKRMSLKTIKSSPLSLLQEAYPDPWMHVTCCVLCSRTSGSATIRSCIGRFFQAFHSPSACLQGCPQAMAALLHPLGLTQARMAAVRAVAQGFLGTDWQDPSEFKGCGKFVSDSWRIFCTGAKEAKGVEDAKLRQYLAWVVRQQQDASDQAGTEEPPAAAAAAPGAVSSRRRKRVESSAMASANKARKGQQPLHQCVEAPPNQQRACPAAPQQRTRAQAKAAEASHCASAAAAAAAVKHGAKHSATNTARQSASSSTEKQVRQLRKRGAASRAGGELCAG